MHEKQPSDVIIFVRYWLSTNLPVREGDGIQDG